MDKNVLAKLNNSIQSKDASPRAPIIIARLLFINLAMPLLLVERARFVTAKRDRFRFLHTSSFSLA
ncbi:MAG: hypothetical protein WCA39_18290 [Nitrososphaeraceae archaeon]